MKIFRAAIEIKRVKISSRRSLDGPFFRLGDFSVKLVGDRPSDFTLNRKEIGYIPIVSLRPHVRVGRRFDELRINSEPIADALDAAFQKMGDAQLLSDLTRVARISAFIKVRRRAADNLEVGDSRKVGGDFILHADGEKRVLLIVAKIIKRQHGDALFGNRRQRR